MCDSTLKAEEQKNSSRAAVPKGIKPFTALSVLNELYVDFLGSLVPGLFTVILGGAAVFLTSCAVYTVLCDQVFTLSHAFSLIGGKEGVLSNLHYELATIMLVSAYVFGAAFYRQDPKRPDARSALHVWASATSTERPGLAVQDTGRTVKSKDNCRHYVELSLFHRAMIILFPTIYLKIKKRDFDSQFPYLCMRCYLVARGLNHLVQYIPWCHRDESTEKYRTKMFVNLLKIRLGAFAPTFERDIVRNEAHIRLATSVWYASAFLFWLGVVCISVLGALLAVKHDGKVVQHLYGPGVVAASVVMLSFVMKYHLTKCIHYMRVREVVYVLESTHLALNLDKGFKVQELIDKVSPERCVECVPFSCRDPLPMKVQTPSGSKSC